MGPPIPALGYRRYAVTRAHHVLVLTMHLLIQHPRDRSIKADAISPATSPSLALLPVNVVTFLELVISANRLIQHRTMASAVKGIAHEALLIQRYFGRKLVLNTAKSTSPEAVKDLTPPAPATASLYCARPMSKALLLCNTDYIGIIPPASLLPGPPGPVRFLSMFGCKEGGRC
eukprot:gene30368-35373_t